MRRTDDTYTDFNQIDDLANQTDATCFVMFCKYSL